ncbi:BPL-N domain-containing protein [Mariniblastus sp.]|nr:BPL-N domain-containing protein [Mariniblastus sp.]MDC3256135.1 BPL-N domain-containing protein [bacterium]
MYLAPQHRQRLLDGNHLKFIRFLIGLLLMVVCISTASGQTKSKLREGALGAGTTWETRWHIMETGVPGPTVLIVGGIHGNEPAGFRAADQIRHWPIKRGKLIVIPQVNRLGVEANIRWSPDHRNDREARDLNRNFGTLGQPEPRTEHCRAVWGFIESERPEWIFDLHEGFDFHRVNPKSVGSSVIAFPDQTKFAAKLQAAVNERIPQELQFDLLDRSGPVVGSLARAGREKLGANSFILETTFKDQPISKRTRQHRMMVSTALLELGMLQDVQVDCLMPKSSSDCLRVGVFDAAGASESKVMRVLDPADNLVATVFGPDDVKMEVLSHLDVLIFPGGSGSAQGKAIGSEGREVIRNYVKSGGGVIGICAGAYLCSSHYQWSLNLMNAKVFNVMVDVPELGRKSMWYRGKAANVEVEVNENGKPVLGISGKHTIRYQNGPILSRGDRPDLPEFSTLAHFRTENGIYEAQKNTMVNAPAVVESQFGKGRVIAISPHFESTKNYGKVILDAVNYVKRR